MRIKKVEITGFKSFVDRTILSFDVPIAGVVGPNGCGKSNIVDAIRWAMGEQSAKHLRGRAMEDVIFNGSDTRGPHGVAEVSLYFENDDGKVPLAYANYTEIVITRRLFRSGDSDYLINKSPCRLMDVTDLFLGTGVGTKAYSTIEQGKVGLIVSSKPEERRAIIEEAAGITKYKTKKKAAEKKMEQTRQNLLRVGDIVGEVEKTLGSLRRQAQKAERYKQYKGELKDLELCDASQRWLGFVALEGVKKEQVETLAEAHSAQEGEVAVREAGAETIRLELLDEERRLGQEQERLYELENRLKLTESTIDFKRREAGGLGERARAASDEVADVLTQAEQAETELRGAVESEAVHVAEAAAVVSSLRGCEEVVARLRTQLGAIEAAHEAVRRQQSAAHAEIARAESNARNCDRRRTDLGQRALRVIEEQDRIGEFIAGERERVAALTKTLAELRQQKLELTEEREQLKLRQGELHKEIAGGEKALDRLRGELHQRRSRLASLHEIAQRYEGFQKGPRAVMKRRQSQLAAGQASGIRALVADVLDTPAEYELCLEAVLGDRLGAVLVDGHADAQMAIEYLEQGAQGRSTFIPAAPRARAATAERAALDDGRVIGYLHELVKPASGYDDVASYLCGEVLVVRDLETALALWTDDLVGRPLVTLKGELLDPAGALSGGSREGAAAGILAQKREMKELEGLVAKLEGDLSSAEALHQELRAEQVKVQLALEALVKNVHQGELELVHQDKDLSRARAELDRAISRQQTLAEDRLELDDARAELEREAAENAESMAKAQAGVSSGESELTAHSGEGNRVRIDLENAGKELTILKVRDAEVRAQKEAAERARVRLVQSSQDLRQRAERLERTIVDSQARGSALSSEVAGAKEELTVLVAERRQRQDRFVLERGAYEARQNASSKEQSELRVRRHALDELARQKGEALLSLRELEMGREHLESQVDERYRIPLAKYVGDYHLRPLLSEPELERISELRGLIERMGEINLTAVEEYAEAEQRHTYLSTQKKDLEEALDQLERAIAKMNKESKDRFRECFEAVNERFQVLFPILFRGGNAKLILTNEDDMLETGVDIVAQPPGKKPSTIDLLSGGEKALTAVSLIFAIFQYKPSPFCILDEVDAPLDEANVGRYNEIIREMSVSSQFIVITHNKRTMEVCDTLYGVTMEEPGVSKLVSVNMQTEKPAARAA